MHTRRRENCTVCRANLMECTRKILHLNDHVDHCHHETIVSVWNRKLTELPSTINMLKQCINMNKQHSLDYNASYDGLTHNLTLSLRASFPIIFIIALFVFLHIVAPSAWCEILTKSNTQSRFRRRTHPLNCGQWTLACDDALPRKRRWKEEQVQTLII